VTWTISRARLDAGSGNLAVPSQSEPLDSPVQCDEDDPSRLLLRRFSTDPLPTIHRVPARTATSTTRSLRARSGTRVARRASSARSCAMPARPTAVQAVRSHVWPRTYGHHARRWCSTTSCTRTCSARSSRRWRFTAKWPAGRSGRRAGSRTSGFGSPAVWSISARARSPRVRRPCRATPQLARYVFERMGTDGARYDVYRIMIAYPPIPATVALQHPLIDPGAD
jgi:hypothetical protein